MRQSAAAKKPATVTPEPVIRDPVFAKRFNQACDVHPHCPPLHSGRLGWVKKGLADLGEDISNETVRKWLEGITKPRPEKGEKLAQLLEVDAAWLMMGYAPEMTPRERKARNAMADGVVNAVAGFIQMDGGHPAFPEDGDQRAERDSINLYAIIRGASYAMHVTLGTADRKTAVFNVPTLHENVMVLGVIREGFSIDAFELTPDIIEKYGNRKGGSIQVSVDGSKLRRIESFSQRF